MPEEKVKHVVYYQFKVIADNYKRMIYVGFKLEDLGSLYIRPQALRHMMKHLIERLRKRDSPFDNTLIRYAFKLRHVIYSFHKSKKYKERFGSWHH
jgi:hypothetical protein